MLLRKIKIKNKNKVKNKNKKINKKTYMNNIFQIHINQNKDLKKKMKK